MKGVKKIPGNMIDSRKDGEGKESEYWKCKKNPRGKYREIWG